MSAKLESKGAGHFAVSGVLEAATVTGLLKRSRQMFAGHPELHLDLDGVTESDSAGLALLIEWLRQALRRRQKIVFQNMPRQIQALAQISEVEDLFTGQPKAA